MGRRPDMCGIAGILHTDPARPAPREAVAAMGEAMRHRGPDDGGVWCGGGAALGMRRLSIIDVAGGRQPIVSEDGGTVIVFNGEIYNYRDLRRGLVERGYRFRSAGDTEVILHLYAEHGASCVDHLRGMFAFAIWDARTQALLLARDRFGIKPLYIVSAGWGVAFASELKALRAVGLTGGGLNWPALDMYFQFGYIPAPATPFLQVRKVPPGVTVQWRRGRPLVERRYWDVPATVRTPTAATPQEVAHLLDASVAQHLVSDVPVAAFLSGGLDSSAVVAAMVAAGEAPETFTARYRGTGAAAADETALAQALAQRYGVRLTIVDVAPEDGGNLEAIVRALDEPLADDSALPTWSLARTVGAQFKVALTGLGGDELFAGYRRHAGLVAGAWYARMPRWMRSWLARGAHALRDPADGSLAVSRLKRFLVADGAGPADRFLAYVSRLGDGERAGLYVPGLREAIGTPAGRAWFAATHARGGHRDGVAAALYLDYTTYLPDDLLALSDRLAMAHSLEIRVPFVDHVLVEQVLPFLHGARFGGWRPKQLLRSAVRDRLPPAHFRAPKRGFVGPTGAWLRGEWRTLLLDELSDARMARLGYFSPAVVRTLVQEHLNGRHNREGILWALVCFSLWHRLHVEPAASASPVTAFDRAV